MADPEIKTEVPIADALDKMVASCEMIVALAKSQPDGVRVARNALAGLSRKLREAAQTVDDVARTLED